MPDRPALRLLIVDDDETFRRMFSGALTDEGFTVETASDGLAALDVMLHHAFDLALVDLRMAGMDGIAFLGELQRRHPETIPVVLTGFGSVPSTVEAMRRGAFDVLPKSATVEEVVQKLRSAVENRIRARAGTGLEDAVLQHESFFGLIGRSPVRRNLFRIIERIQAFDRPVLLFGESGTGKELVARALHAGGRRSKRPLIAVNCASLRENFVENELFGHVRGAFTGAVVTKPGLFELADGGTLLIDEIGEMPIGAQAALLRVLETGRYRPIGGQEEVRVDVRVIASTNRNIERMVAEERFRADLLFRISVCRIDLPPLRTWIEDMPLLLNHFLDVSATARAVAASIDPSVLPFLMGHRWPGNVRELFNALESAAILADGGRIKPEHFALGSVASTSPSPIPCEGNEPTLEEHERLYIEELCGRNGNNIAAVARILRVDPTTIRRKLRRWKLEA